MLVFAHRGSSGVAPGNTLKAFELAIKAGTCAIESDVRATRDGALVFFHDGTVKIGDHFAVPSSWFPSSWFRSFDAGNGEHVPFVDEVFAHFEAAGVLKKITWSIDVPGHVEFKRLMKIARTFNIEENMQACATSCWNNASWHGKAPRMVQVWSIRPWQVARFEVPRIVAACKKYSVDVLNIKLENTSSDLVMQARDAGLRIYIWDVHDEARYKKAISFNPDAIYTDYPSRAINGTWNS